MGISKIFRDLLIGRAFSTEQGRIKMFEKMDWSLYPSKGLAHYFQAIGETFGEDYLFEISYKNGIKNGKEMINSMGLKPMGGWVTQKAITNLLDFLGYGKIEFVKSKIGPGNHHHAIIHSTENPIVEHAIRMFEKKQMACVYWRGLLSGHAAVELGIKDIKFTENKCIADGSDKCIYESRS